MHRRGFTLIELLVVIAIIGVLSSVVLASLNTARAKARDAQRRSEMVELRTAIEAYYADKGVYPVASGWHGVSPGSCGTVGTLSGPTGYIPNLAPTYISELPVDPSYISQPCAGYLYSSDGAGYVLLDHALPESYSPSNAFYDPIRPTYSWKVCSGAACGW